MLGIFYEAFLLAIGVIIFVTSFDNMFTLVCGIIIILASGIRLYKNIKIKSKEERI